MIPGKYNMVCAQGATFELQLTVYEDDQLFNLTLWDARMQVREKYSSPNYVIELSTDNNQITLGGAAGTVSLLVSHSVTEGIVAKDYVYDLELYNATNVNKIIEGVFSVTPEVTR